jgi:hypothetical protein
MTEGRALQPNSSYFLHPRSERAENGAGQRVLRASLSLEIRTIDRRGREFDKMPPM